MSGEIILTGAHGWLGSRMLHGLLHGLPDYPDVAAPAGSQLRCFYRDGETPVAQDAAAASPISVAAVFGDLSRSEDCERLFSGTDEAILLHAAGVAHPRRVSEFASSNVDATLNLLKAGSRAGLRRAVIVSSYSPVGVSPEPGQPFTEDSPYSPNHGYGRSKMEMELRARDYAAELDIELVIIRPPWFYGPFQPLSQARFFSMIRGGRAPLLGAGLNQRSLVYIDNLCHGLALAVRQPQAAGETYWIADAEPYTMNAIFDTVETVLEQDFRMDVAHKRMYLPSIAAELAYYVDAAIQAAGFYHRGMHELSELNSNIACSVAKARQELGYEPKIALREGMRRSIGWYLDRGVSI